MNQVFGESFIVFAKLEQIGQLLLKNMPSKLLLHFIEYRLDQLNSKHTKIAVNLANSILKAVFKINVFGPPTTKWGPSKILAKLTRNHHLMVNIFRLHKYQTFDLMKCVIFVKSDLPKTYSVS